MSGRCIMANCSGKDKALVADFLLTSTKITKTYLFSENKIELPKAIPVMKYHVNAWYEEFKANYTQNALVIVDADACPLGEREWHKFMKNLINIKIDVKCITSDPSNVPSWIMNYCSVLTVPNMT